jgi:hypothetical protein
LVDTDGREYTEVQAEGADKAPASEKEEQMKMTMVMGDGYGESAMEMRKMMVMKTTR